MDSNLVFMIWREMNELCLGEYSYFNHYNRYYRRCRVGDHSIDR